MYCDNGCEVQSQDYQNRLAFGGKIIEQGAVIEEYRTRKKASNRGNREVECIKGYILSTNNACVCQSVVVQSKEEAFSVAKRWARDFDEKGEAIEGGVL